MSRQQHLVRKWRDSEAEYVLQMAELLPLPLDVKSKLSKPAILRLSAAHIRAKQLENSLGGSVQDVLETTNIMDARGGFLLTVDDTGLILSASDHVYIILGHYSHEMIGMNILEYLHPDDYSYFHHRLRPKKSPQNHIPGLCSDKGAHSTSEAGGVSGEFSVRLKYKITNKANKIKQTGFVSLQMHGVLKVEKSTTSEHEQGSKCKSMLIVACYPYCLVPSMELDFFETRCVMRFDNEARLTYIDDGCLRLFGPNGRDLLGLNIKEFIHPGDVNMWVTSIGKMYHQRGSLLINYMAITREGELFQAISRDTIVFGPKGERLFSVDVDYIVRRNHVRIKNWPVRRNVVFIIESFGLPGEGLIPMKFRLDEVVDLSSPVYDFSDVYQCQREEKFQLTDNSVSGISVPSWPLSSATQPCRALTDRVIESQPQGFLDFLYEKSSDMKEPMNSVMHGDSHLETDIKQPCASLAESLVCDIPNPMNLKQIKGDLDHGGLLTHSQVSVADSFHSMTLQPEWLIGCNESAPKQVVEKLQNEGTLLHEKTSSLMMSSPYCSSLCNDSIPNQLKEMQTQETSSNFIPTPAWTYCCNGQPNQISELNLHSMDYEDTRTEGFKCSGLNAYHSDPGTVSHMQSISQACENQATLPLTEMDHDMEGSNSTTSSIEDITPDVLEFITNPSYFPQYAFHGQSGYTALH